MKRKLLAILLLFSLTLSLASCKRRDEDGAMADVLIQDEVVLDETPSDEQEDETPDDETPDDETPDDETPDDETPDDNQPEDETPPPPASTGDKYTVTYDLGYNDRTETVKTDGELEEYAAQRSGFNFDGWYNGKTKWDFATDTVTEDITLTAKWTAIEYTITYVADGAEIPKENPTTYTADSKTIELLAPKSTRKVFAGWSIDNGNGTIISNTIDTGTFGNLTLTATWDEKAVIYGKYEYDGNTENGKEDLVWLKLKEENGKTLLITRDIIDCKPYSTHNGKAITWVSSDIRKWLNSSFMASFTTDEKKEIAVTKLETPGSYDGSKTDDQVFFFSLEEVKTYLPSYTERRAKVTPYAISNNAQNSDKGGWWWLRTKISDYGAALIENDGNIRSIGYSADLTTIGIRPAMWVNTSALS